MYQIQLKNIDETFTGKKYILPISIQSTEEEVTISETNKLAVLQFTRFRNVYEAKYKAYGVSVLAGTTDTYIIRIGGTYDPYFHSPVRNGNRNYKISHVRGNCPIFCTDDITNYVDKHGTIRLLPEITCVNETYYACTPHPDLVLKEIIKVSENGVQHEH